MPRPSHSSLFYNPKNIPTICEQKCLRFDFDECCHIWTNINSNKPCKSYSKMNHALLIRVSIALLFFRLTRFQKKILSA
jgi:hypothetical protein